ncbi:hypothetical protein GCM10022226_11040 [Sphaerisporangium flaviroseum]|uniref:Serine/threonine protein kinase n=1 Tax=Sphaerisporangium flaviroseum TaxID=509199 RepID=A0ABP7HJR7_9ACTN
MDRDGPPSSHEEDPLQQIDPLGIEWKSEPERPRGDVLSDGWTPGDEPARAGSDDSSDLVWADQERAEDPEQSESLEGYEHLYRPEGYEVSHDDERSDGYERSDDENWDPDGEHDPDGEGGRGFLGPGWTGDLEEEKGNKNKQLILALVAIVVLAVAGGWIVSSSVGSSPEAACSTPGNCASVEQQDPALTDSPTVGPSLTDPAAESTAGPEETTSPSETPTPTTSQVRQTRQPTSRPTPTRTRVHSPKPSSPRSSSRPQPEDQPTEDNPKPSPTPAPTTQAPKPAPSPTKSQGGGVLDWLF